MERNEQKLHRIKLVTQSKEEIVISYKSMKDREYMNDLLEMMHEGLQLQKAFKEGVRLMEEGMDDYLISYCNRNTIKSHSHYNYEDL
jgi:nucleoside diphosphate kinase